jgi:WD40 repeat protein
LHVLYGHTAGITCVDISIELDLAVCGSLDGTVNMYNVRNGQYIKTLNLRTQQIPDLRVLNVKLGEQRHILIYSTFTSEIKINDLARQRVRTHMLPYCNISFILFVSRSRTC